MTWLCTPQRLPCYRDTRLTGYTGRTGCKYWIRRREREEREGREGGKERKGQIQRERGIINYNKIIIIITIINFIIVFRSTL